LFVSAHTDGCNGAGYKRAARLHDDRQRIKLHTVLSPEGEPEGSVHRDLQACVNMRAIYVYWLLTGQRHPAFVRATSL
jgi:hypothetical protein